MNKFFIILLFETLIFFSLGCSGSKNEIVDRTPGWYDNVPISEEYFFVSEKSAEFDDMSDSRLEAEIKARAQMARTIKTNLQEIIDYSRISKTNEKSSGILKRKIQSVVNASLEFCEVKKQYSYKKDGFYIVYVLYRAPKKEIYKLFVAEVKKDGDLYESFKNSQAFKKIEME